MQRLVFAAVLLASTAPAFAESRADVCVVNAAGQRLLFAVVPQGGERLTATLGPGERLCSASPEGAGGFVSVFRDAASDEGCSRLVAPPGGTRTLRRYASFDRCAWDDNT